MADDADEAKTAVAASDAKLINKNRLRLAVFIYDILWIGGLAYLWTNPANISTNIAAVFAGFKNVLIWGTWFGALGGILISLKGIYDHAGEEWNDSYDLWHFGRPISGAVAGFMTVVLLSAVAPTKAQPESEKQEPPWALYAAAFILGTQERRFFNLLSEVAKLVVQVPDEKGTPGLKVTEVHPREGQTGTVVVIRGQGIEAGAAARFGSAALEKPVVAPDGTSIAGIVPERPIPGGAEIDLIVSNASGVSFILPKGFKYTS